MVILKCYANIVIWYAIFHVGLYEVMSHEYTVIRHVIFFIYNTSLLLYF